MILLWHAHPMTHCTVIEALFNQITIKINLEKRFLTSITKCLSSSNSILKFYKNVLFVTLCLLQVKTTDVI